MPIRDPSASPIALLTRRLQVRRAELAGLRRSLDAVSAQMRWRMRALEDEIACLEADIAMQRELAA